MCIKKDTGLWLKKGLWLIGLSCFFFSSYGLSNHISALRSDVGVMVYNWEHIIPLWPWTIIPYWSIDVFYGLAILLTETRKALNTLGLRLLFAQLVCIGCFLAFPLRFTFERPELSGFSGLLFELLAGFDKPYNQAPSLHITLLVILFDFYRQHIKSDWFWVLKVWFALIGISVLTTWQHHFFDIPTGIFVGCFCIWLWPDNHVSPLKNMRYPKQWRLFLIYAITASITMMLCINMSRSWLWLGWLSLSLFLVSLSYAFIGGKGFQKQCDGRFSLPVLIIYFPYLVCAWLNSKIWTVNSHKADLVIDRVYLGSIPHRSTIEHHKLAAIVDLCAELPFLSRVNHYCLIPILDLTLPPQSCLDHAVRMIDAYRQQGNVMVCCALGYSRSAQVVVAWLLWSKKVDSLKQALDKVKQARPRVVITLAQQQHLENWWRNHNES